MSNKKKIKIITTVGLSIFTNFVQEEVKNLFEDESDEVRHENIFTMNNLKQAYQNDYANKYKEKYFKETLQSYWLKGIQKVKDGKEVRWEFKKNHFNTNASAEIKSICKIAAAEPNTEFEVYLLTSDTATAKCAAHLIKWFFDKYKEYKKKTNPKFEVTIKEIATIKGLRIDNLTSFKDEGIQDLITKIDDIAGRSKESKNTILNITGGYKALAPIMTLIGQIKGLSVQYIYEESDALLKIGDLPFNFDWVVVEAIGGYLDKIKRGETKRSDLNEKAYAYLDKMHLISGNEEGGIVSLSTVGLLLYTYFKDRTPMSSNKFGFIIEYKLFQCFSEIDQFKDSLKVNNIPIYRQPRKYIPNWEKKYYNTHDDNLKIYSKNGNSEIGDIDLLLENESKETVLCEVKALFSTKGKLKDNKSNYHKQIAARLKYYNEDEKLNRQDKIKEVLFILYKIVIEKEQGSSTFDNDLPALLETFKNKLDCYNKVRFTVLGLTIPYLSGGEHDFKIDYTNFLKKSLIEDGITWELIYSH